MMLMTIMNTKMTAIFTTRVRPPRSTDHFTGPKLCNRASERNWKSMSCSSIVCSMLTFAYFRLVILGISRTLGHLNGTDHDRIDYLMLNTDRGADNYMIKYCEGDHEKALIDVAPSRSVRLEMPVMTELRRTEPNVPRVNSSSYQPTLSPVPSGSTTPNTDYRRRPHIHIAAIDNSLSFPHEHPQGWRSYTYGWLYLPVSVIGRPFSEKTRNHFLPLLTSKAWWEETTYQLEKLFAVDPDFHPKMFAVSVNALFCPSCH